jgi:hypothetical protein
VIVHAVTDFRFADSTKVWYIKFPIAASVGEEAVTTFEIA